VWHLTLTFQLKFTKLHANSARVLSWIYAQRSGDDSQWRMVVKWSTLGFQMRYIISRMEYSHRRSKHLAQKTLLAKRDPSKITSNKTYSPKVFIVKIPRFCHKLTLLYPCNSQVAADPDKLCSCLRLELQRGWERAKVGHARCTVEDTISTFFSSCLSIVFVHFVHV